MADQNRTSAQAAFCFADREREKAPRLHKNPADFLRTVLRDTVVQKIPPRRKGIGEFLAHHGGSEPNFGAREIWIDSRLFLLCASSAQKSCGFFADGFHQRRR